MPDIEALRLTPEYHERVWGGQRLKPNPKPIGEAWIVHEGNQIASGHGAGRTLAEVVEQQPLALLGARAVERTGTRFPLLLKLLDTADWLSLQVHPDDARAMELEGPGEFGKTEAWHILQAEPDARLICGLRPGATPKVLREAIEQGTILDWVQYLAARPGDTVFVGAGTIHALGPGLLLYEVQQTSDITYRVWDWNRPQAAGRSLHIDKSLAVADMQASGRAIPLPDLTGAAVLPLLACPYFTLELVWSQKATVPLHTRNESFHALTVVEGEARVAGDGWDQSLSRFETIIVPAVCGAYELRPGGACRVLKVSV